MICWEVVNLFLVQLFLQYGHSQNEQDPTLLGGHIPIKCENGRAC